MNTISWRRLPSLGLTVLAMLAVAALRRPRAGPAVPAHA